MDSETKGKENRQNGVSAPLFKNKAAGEWFSGGMVMKSENAIA